MGMSEWVWLCCVVEKEGNMIQGCDSAVILNDHTLPSEDACIGRLRPYIYSFFSLCKSCHGNRIDVNKTITNYEITHFPSLSFSFLSWKPDSTKPHPLLNTYIYYSLRTAYKSLRKKCFNKTLKFVFNNSNIHILLTPYK